MNLSTKPIVISVLIIVALIIISGFLNDAYKNNDTQVSAKERETYQNLDNIAKIEGQKIKSISGSVVELENGEKIDFGKNPIKCQVGDIIENYTVQNQSLICVRKDNNGNILQSTIMPIGAGIVTGILTSYIASKIFTQNNGINRMPNSYDYRGSNGQVFNSVNEVQNSSNSSQNTGSGSYRRSFGTGGSGFIGTNNNNNTTGESNTNGSTKSTGGSKGGVSTGSKGGVSGG
jgi:hypothetical protein